jgi:hypothetical protein
MENKYKIKIDAPVPSEEEIASHKNFDRVLRKYRRTTHKQPLHSTLQRVLKYLPVIILSIIITILILFYNKVLKRNQPVMDNTEEKIK